MGFLTKKRLFVILPILLIILGFAAFPIVINSYVNHVLKPERIKDALLSNVKAQTGLRVSVLGVKYRFPAGIILTGVKISHPEPGRDYLFRTENLIIRVSLLGLLRKTNPFSSLRVSQGKFNPWGLSAGEWSKVFKLFSRFSSSKTKKAPGAKTGAKKNQIDRKTEGKNATSAIAGKKDEKKPGAGRKDPSAEKPTAFRLPSDIEIHLENLALIVPARVSASSPELKKRRKLILSASILPGPGRYRITLHMDKKEETSPRLIMNGWWKRDTPRNLRYRFFDIPAGFALDLSKIFPIPWELQYVLKSIKITRGVIDGKGSVDTFAQGSGINIDAEYRDLEAHVAFDDDIAIGVSASTGRFNYNTVYRKIDRGPDYAAISMKQEHLNFSLKYLINKKKKREIKTQADAFFIRSSQKGKSPNLVYLDMPGVETGGQARVRLQYTAGRGWIKPLLDIRLKDMELFLTGGVFKPGSQARKKSSSWEPERIRISRLRARQKGEQYLTIDSSGTLEKKASFQLNLKSDSSFIFTRSGGKPVFIMRQHMGGKLQFKNLSYGFLVRPLSRIPSHIQRRGSRKNAARAEDEGLLRYHRFISLEKKQALLDYLKLNISVEFKDMNRPGNSLPLNLRLTLYKHENYVNIKLPEITTPNSQLSFEYVLSLQYPIPYHKIDFTASVKKNGLSFPEFLGTGKAPEELYLKYFLTGQGWLPRDLINKTYSHMTFHARKIELGNLTAARILKHKLPLSPRAFFAEEFGISRSTSGDRFKYTSITLRSNELNSSGSGDYVPGQGGRVDMAYRLTTGKQGRMKYKILKNETWTPAEDG